MGPCEKCIVLFTTVICPDPKCQHYAPVEIAKGKVVYEGWGDDWPMPLCRTCYWLDNGKGKELAVHNGSNTIGTKNWPAVRIGCCNEAAPNSIHTTNDCGRKGLRCNRPMGHTSGPHVAHSESHPRIFWPVN